MQTLKRIITSFQNQSQINACSECLAGQPEQGPKSLVASHFYLPDIFHASLSTTTVPYKTNVYDRNLNSEKPEGEVLSWHPSCQLVKVLPPTQVGTSPKWPILCGVTRHKIGHFGDVPQANPCAWYDRNKLNKSTHSPIKRNVQQQNKHKK